MATSSTFGVDTESISAFTVVNKAADSSEESATGQTTSASGGDTVSFSDEAMALLQDQQSGTAGAAATESSETGTDPEGASVAFALAESSQGSGGTSESSSSEDEESLEDAIDVLKQQISNLEQQIASLEKDPSVTQAKASETTGTGQDAASDTPEKVSVDTQAAQTGDATGEAEAASEPHQTSAEQTTGAHASGGQQATGDNTKADKLDSMKMALATLEAELMQLEQEAEKYKLDDSEWT